MLPESEAAWITLNEVFPFRAIAAELSAEICPGRQSGNGRGYRRVLVRPVQARVRQQLGPTAVQAGVHAISVVLDLIQPFQALGRRVHHFSTLRLAPFWKTCRIASRLICRRFRHHNRGKSVGLYMGVTF